MWFAFYFTGVLASLVASVYYSIMARRRGIHPLEGRMTLGKMNMALGSLLLLFGANQFTFDDLTTVRIVIALILLAVGGVNLLYGARHFWRYRREWKAALQKES